MSVLVLTQSREEYHNGCDKFVQRRAGSSSGAMAISATARRNTRALSKTHRMARHATPQEEHLCWGCNDSAASDTKNASDHQQAFPLNPLRTQIALHSTCASQ